MRRQVRLFDLTFYAPFAAVNTPVFFLIRRQYAGREHFTKPPN
jgi:hypothetical protein